MLRLTAITIHAHTPALLARFWSEVLGLPIDPADETAIRTGSLSPTAPVLLGRQDDLHVWISPAEEVPLPGGPVHLDVQLDADMDPQRLLELGAKPEWTDPLGRWTVYTDPEGNRFCAVPAT